MLGNTPKLQGCQCLFYDLGSDMSAKLGGTWGGLGGTGCSPSTCPLLGTSHLLTP